MTPEEIMEANKRKLVEKFLLNNFGHFSNVTVDEFIGMIEVIAVGITIKP